MKIVDGMKCRFICAYGTMCENGIVISVNEDGSFSVVEDMKCPVQYNDSFMTFTTEDIGNKVFFEQGEAE